jgi:hypothetical protein
MKLKLMSNFYDYYDHWFDLDGSTFERSTKGGMVRGRMFGFLRNKGFDTPIYGIVSHLKNAFYLEDDDKIVVYTNENLHCGEGKKLMTLKDAYTDKKLQKCLCTQYINSDNPFNYAVSYRHLQIGNRAFWLRYISYNDWRSNYGDGDIELIEERKSIKIPSVPLYAIDFVEKNGIYYAIDFNISPGIRGTGVEDILPAKEVVDLIKESYFEQSLNKDNLI